MVTLGAGFAGVNVARELERRLSVGSGFEITLIRRENYLLITPLRFEAGSGLSEPHHQRRSPTRRHENLDTLAAPGALFSGGPKRQRAHARILSLVGMADLLPGVNAAREVPPADQARLDRGHVFSQQHCPAGCGYRFARGPRRSRTKASAGITVVGSSDAG